MKHRAVSSKIKYQHHMIQGLRELLEKIEPWDEIQSIIPARTKHTKSSQRLKLTYQYDTPSGIKCKAVCGNSVQEVFFVTNQATTLIEKIKTLR